MTMLSVVPLDLLDALAAESPGPVLSAAPSPSPPAPGHEVFKSRLLVDRWLTDLGVAFRVKPEPDPQGRTTYVLAACPFDPSHADPDACIMQAVDGKLSAKCFHNGCQGRGWQAFKTALGPPDRHHYDPPLNPSRGRRPRPVLSADPGTEELTGPGRGTPSGIPGGDVIRIDPATVPVAETMGAITDVLLQAGDCYCRAERTVRVSGETVTPILSASELAGLVNAHAEVVIVGHGEEYRPLPTQYATTWLNHPQQLRRLPVIELFTANPVYTRDWRLAPRGYDAATGLYYAGPSVPLREGMTHLEALLRDFCFRKPADRANYLGILLTAILIPHFLGSKPAVLFTGNQPGLGKSILAQILAILRDGRPTVTATYNSNDEEFEKRLGAIVHRGTTTVIIDNAKANGRSARIESACLERSITDPILSFRLLGHSREIRVENSHLFCITANTPEVSRDLVTRCVLVELFHEGDPTRRRFTIGDPEGYAMEHRVEILGELLGMIERWLAAGAPRAAVDSRFNKKAWGPILGGILAHAGVADFLSNTQTVVQLDETRQQFAYLVSALADHPQGWWSSSQLVELAQSEGLFASEFKDLPLRGQCTRLGMIAARYVDEAFPLDDHRTAVFRRREERKGNVYLVDLLDESLADV